MSLETRIALIGVVGALTGTLVRGAVTYAVTWTALIAIGIAAAFAVAPSGASKLHVHVGG